jgi:hypothetical protein
MSPILVLTGLMALAYLGTMLVSGRALRGTGLPSGTEFLLLGVLLGPKFLGLISSETRATFEPFNAVALSWLAVVSGGHYGYAAGGVGVPTRTMARGLGLAVLSAGFAALAANLVARRLEEVAPAQLVLFTLGIGAVSAETTRHAVRWVVQRYGATGPLTSFIGEMAEADDAIALVLLALIAAFSATPTPLAGVPWSPALSLGVSLLLGAALGVTIAALFNIEPRKGQRWGILIGATLLGVGVSLKLGLSAVWVAFVMGVVASLASAQRIEIGKMLEPTERPTMLPALVLAGAYVSLPPSLELWVVAVAAVGARLLAKGLSGRLLVRWHRDSSAQKTNAAAAGGALLPAGILSITAGLACAAAIKGPIGELVLFIAVANTVTGELLGTPALRFALKQAGELHEPAKSSGVVRAKGAVP